MPTTPTSAWCGSAAPPRPAGTTSGPTSTSSCCARRASTEWLVNRAVRRGQLPEAVSLYLTFALGGLVRLLRIEHCPWRHDFGLRYLHTDLPADVAARVDALVPGPDNGDLAELSAACFAWTDELLAAR